MVQYSRQNVAYDAFQEDTEMRRRRRAEDRKMEREQAVRQGLWEGLKSVRAGDVDNGKATGGRDRAMSDQERRETAVSPGGTSSAMDAGPAPEGYDEPAVSPGGTARAGGARDTQDQESGQKGSYGTSRGREAMQGVTAARGGSEDFRDPITESLLEQGPAAASAAYERYQNVASSRAEQAQSAREMQNDMEEKAIDALNAGNMAGYYHYASQAGMQLPESILQNTRTRQLFGQGAKLAKEVYGDNEAQAGRFTQAYMQSGGNAAAAYQAAGVPQDRPSYTIEEVMRDEQRVLARINESTGETQYLRDEQGNVVQAGEQPGQDGTGAGGDLTQQEAAVKRLQETVQTEDGQPITYGEALQLYGALQNPDARARIIADQLEQWRENQYEEPTAEEVQAKREEITQYVNNLMGLSGYNLAPSRQPAQTGGQGGGQQGGGGQQTRREPPPGQGGDRGGLPVIDMTTDEYGTPRQESERQNGDGQGQRSSSWMDYLPLYSTPLQY
jgi:hypothetical protein